MLNGIPLSEVQAKEKRGQIVEYPGQLWLGEPRRNLDGLTGSREMALPVPARTGLPKTGLPSQGPDRLLTRSKAQEPASILRRLQQGRQSGQYQPNQGTGSLGRLWSLYYEAIAGSLAKTSWMKGASINLLPLALILGLGVFLPVKIIFAILSVFFLPWREVSQFISGMGTVCGIGLILYFVVRKLANTI
jgi:hypothetical protein